MAAAAAMPKAGDDRGRRVLLEVCVDTPGDLAVAYAHDADRIELCSALSVGGLTPSYGQMEHAAAFAAAGTPVVAMIRPRAGDFVYNEGEIKLMKADIRAARAAGLDGVVLGASSRDGSLNEEALGELVKEAKALVPGAPSRPLIVTLHRAVDLNPDPVAAVETSVRLGVDRILTSGGAATAMEGAGVIKQMVDQSAGRVCIMAGSGVSVENAAELVAATGVTEVHASCSRPRRPSSNDSVLARARAFGFVGGGEGGEQRETDEDKVRELAALLHKNGRSVVRTDGGRAAPSK